jgi:hypothetical protein
MAVIAGAALAFGAVEPWAIAILGLAIIAFLVLWIVKGVIDGRLEIIAPSTSLPLLALILVGVFQRMPIMESSGASRATSLDAEATGLATEVLLILLIAFLLSANFLAKAPVINWLRNFLIVFGFVLSVFALIQHFTWDGKFYWMIKPSWQPPTPFGPFVNRNHFAGYVEMLAPIPLALIIRRAVRGERVFLYGFATAIMGLAVVMSLSRGGMISLVAGLTFVVALGFKPARAWARAWERREESAGGAPRGHGNSEHPHFAHSSPWLLVYRSPFRASYVVASRIGALIMMLIMIGAGVWWIGADPVIRRFENSEFMPARMDADRRGETFFESRGWIWRDTAAMIRDKWTTGVGLGAYPTAYPIYDSLDGTLVVKHAHNDYLQVMADAGILGAAIALWFIFLVMRDIFRASSHESRAMSGLALGAGGGIFALLVHSLFDFNFQIPSNALLFLVMTSIVSQIAVEAKKSGAKPNRR